MPTQTILITGATAGIGRHLALDLARKGNRVIATGRNRAALDALVAEANTARISAVLLDVDDRESLARAADAVAKLTEGRGVDVLVNNAGFGQMAPLLEVREEDVRAMFETNVFGLLAVTRAMLPAMLRRKRGRVINVSSVGGRFTLPMFGAYNATKHAVESLSDALRIELQPLGIRVIVVEPAATKTDFARTSVKKLRTYARDDSPYAAFYARADAIVAQSERTATDPAHVVRVIERAITAPRPRARYVVPFAGRVMVALFAWLPTAVLDWVLSRVFGLEKASYAERSSRSHGA